MCMRDADTDCMLCYIHRLFLIHITETVGTKFVCSAAIQELNATRMWADAQRDGRSAEYRWRRLRKFRHSIPCTAPQTLADAHCSSVVQ